MTSEASHNAISSLAPASGQRRHDLLDGPTIANSGPGRARASRSRLPAKAGVSTIHGICGRTSIDSLAPAGPLASWENRLRVRLGMVGSTESPLIWREKITPAGASISRLARWTPPISDSASTGSPWPTPTVADVEGGRKTRSGARSNEPLLNGLMVWSTPSARDWKDSAGMATEREDGRSRLDQLLRQMVATWVTPQAMDGHKGSLPARPHDTGISLPQHMASAVPAGPTLNGSPVTTARRGAPNPVFACWLMGWSDELTSGVLLAIQSMKRWPRK